MMRTLTDFKAELERTLRIVAWNPSQQDLRTIASQVACLRTNSRHEIARIVVEVYPNARFLSLEGLDNSDLRTLLALATAAATQG